MHSEFKASREALVHFLQIWIVPDRKGVAPRYQQQHFPVGEKRGRLRLIISPGGDDGSLSVYQDVRVYAGLFDGDEQQATPMPPICWKRASTCESFRPTWATVLRRPPLSTPILPHRRNSVPSKRVRTMRSSCPSSRPAMPPTAALAKNSVRPSARSFQGMRPSQPPPLVLRAATTRVPRSEAQPDIQRRSGAGAGSGGLRRRGESKGVRPLCFRAFRAGATDARSNAESATRCEVNKTRPAQARLRLAVRALTEELPPYAAAQTLEQIVKSDYGEAAGGENQAPNPIEMLLSAFAACIEAAFYEFALHEDLKISSVSADVEGTLDLRGLFMIDDVSAGFKDVKFVLRIESPDDETKVRALAEKVIAHCPVVDSLKQMTPVSGEIVING